MSNEIINKLLVLESSLDRRITEYLDVCDNKDIDVVIEELMNIHQKIEDILKFYKEYTSDIESVDGP